MAHLMKAHGVPGPAILAVTFTNKAAGEMRERVMKLSGESSIRHAPWVATFHSFCVRVLRRDGAPLAEVRPGFTPQFNIYDDADQLAIVKGVFRRVGLDEKFMPYRGALSAISAAKNRQETPADFYRKATDPKASRLAVIFDQYEGALRQANALDFDDLLLETVRLLRVAAPVREAYNRRFEFVMVDEYQDTNRSQYELMRLLTEVRENVAVVGDEDQSIYGWRGADIRNILDFQQDFPRATVIRLEQNYRSVRNILEAAAAVVSNNKSRLGKTLWTDAGAGEKIQVYDAVDGENEALFIADRIDQLLRDEPTRKIAILYRTNSQSRPIEEALRRYNRKYVVVGGLSFYERAEVKDLLSYLRVLLNPRDNVSLWRIINTPARGIGKSTLDQIDQYAAERKLPFWEALEQMREERLFPTRAESAVNVFARLIHELREGLPGKPVHQVLSDVLVKTGYQAMLEADQTPEAEGRLGNIQELLNAAADATERGESIAEFLDHAALVAQTDEIDQQAQVSMLTMHNAKGLEWPVVFIAGLEEGLFPHSRSRESEAHLEEERRLCYVALTRAQQRLFLSSARYRRRYGGGAPEATLKSRFLSEIPRELMAKAADEPNIPQVDLSGERWEVREVVKKNLFTGKTYNSVDNIRQFFESRGMPAPRAFEAPSAAAPPAAAPLEDDRPPWEESAPAAPAPSKVVAKPTAPPASGKVLQMPLLGMEPAGPAPASRGPVAKPAPAHRPTAATTPAPKRNIRPGATVMHAKYGRGTVLRREGEGDDAKLTISFSTHGLKKMIEKFADLKLV
jgi:DNA helicase-2/ATP-dependent DNA helicase PcrA